MDESLESGASSGTDTRGNLLDRRARSPHFRHFRALLLALLGVAISAVVIGALSRGREAARCPRGKVPMGHRCCWQGQSLASGHCVGPARACTAPHVPLGNACRLPPKRVFVPGGTLRVAPSDWQAEGAVEARTVEVAGFLIDQTEVTTGAAPEPDLPLAGLDWSRAQASCRSRGGRLPTLDEWMFAAAGPTARRYPWGQTGLVCRRAAFGLAQGPCARSERPGPDTVGSRPDGATPEGLLDLVGNVAEWAGTAEHPWAMGGSFRSALAGELQTWSRARVEGGREDVGFRCVYDVTAPPEAPSDKGSLRE